MHSHADKDGKVMHAENAAHLISHLAIHPECAAVPGDVKHELGRDLRL